MSLVALKQFMNDRPSLFGRCQAICILLMLVGLYVLRFEGKTSLQGDEIVKPSYTSGVIQATWNDSEDASDTRLYSPLSRDTIALRPNHRPSLTDAHLDRFIVVPEYKLLFCYTEKVGCSMFNHLFRMLRLLHPDLLKNREEAEYQAQGTWFRNTPSHHNISKSDLEEMLMDKSWTKAAFFRDPATRFLSAYRSKCVLNENLRRNNHCHEAFGKPKPRWSSVSFDDALFQLSHNPDQVFGDVHFAPAHRFCGGLDTTLDYYDFVHQLTTSTTPDHIERLFSMLGVDSNTSEYLIENVVRTGGTALDRDEEFLQNLYPNGLHLLGSATQKQGHNTGSNQGNILQSSYGSDENVELMWERYSGDYDLFELPMLTLEELHRAGV